MQTPWHIECVWWLWQRGRNQGLRPSMGPGLDSQSSARQLCSYLTSLSPSFFVCKNRTPLVGLCEG